ncbi:hypothetical protein [Vibrio sp. DNB22_12_1]
MTITIDITSFDEVSNKLKSDLQELKLSNEIEPEVLAKIEQIVLKWCTKPPQRPSPWNPKEFLSLVRKDLNENIVENRLHPVSIVIILIIRGLTIQDAH